MVLAKRAALTILACRPRLDEVHALMPAVTELAGAGCTLGLVCVGDGPYSPTEIARAARIELLGAIPDDHRAAAEFDEHGLAAGRAFRRSRLAATVTELAGLVRSRCASNLQAQAMADPQPTATPAARPAAQLRPAASRRPPGLVTEVELVPDREPLAAPSERRPFRAPSVSAEEAELALPVSLAVRTARASAAEARSAEATPEEKPGHRPGWPRLGRRDRPDRSSDVG
jgi:hypothetical protein